MKSIMKHIGGFLCAATLVGAMSSCERQDYPYRYRATDGVPTVDFVRYADQDVFISQAFMDEVICIVGTNLTSVHDVLFNDQAAILNTSYITPTTMIVAVPSDPATVKTDKMYLITAAKDTVTYDFKVLPPSPKISSMSNEWAAAGETVTLSGRYFIDVTSLSLPGAAVTDYTVVNSETITFTVPAGATAGPVEIVTESGSGRSVFQYKDSRNVLFDFDGNCGGMAAGNGWRAPATGHIHYQGDDAFDAIDGAYMWFGGQDGGLGAGSTDVWGEDAYSFDYWPSDSNTSIPILSTLPTFSEYITKYGVGGLALKFECLIPSSNPWSSCSMQIIFSRYSDTSNESMNNTYITDAALPRALWTPWQSTGTYDTADEWTTVSVPLTNFCYGPDGSSLDAIDSSYLAGFTMFVYAGYSGTACDPVLAIDHIRVVPL